MRQIVTIGILFFGLIYQLLNQSSNKETYVLNELEKECHILLEQIKSSSKKRKNWQWLEDYADSMNHELRTKTGLIELSSLRNTLQTTASEHSYIDYICPTPEYAVVDTLNNKVKFYTKLCYSNQIVNLNGKVIILQDGEGITKMNRNKEVQEMAILNPVTRETRTVSLK